MQPIRCKNVNVLVKCAGPAAAAFGTIFRPNHLAFLLRGNTNAEGCAVLIDLKDYSSEGAGIIHVQGVADLGNLQIRDNTIIHTQDSCAWNCSCFGKSIADSSDDQG